MTKKKTVYYRNEITDDFARNHIETKPLRDGFCYIHRNPFWKIGEFLLYRVIAQPLAFLFMKLVYAQRFIGRQAVSAASSGAYVYANHTNGAMDAFVPNLLRWRYRCNVVVGPDAMSIRGLNSVIEMLGGMPLGTTLRQKAQMHQCVKAYIRQSRLVTIYPEAHIWPYYTGIRPFPADSFAYPARDGMPVYAMTNCYQKRRLGRLPKVVTYVDGPYFADMALPLPERKERLRQTCYDAMNKRAAEASTYEYIHYEKLP